MFMQSFEIQKLFWKAKKFKISRSSAQLLLKTTYMITVLCCNPENNCLFNLCTYFWSLHFNSRWSNILMTGPHLSGLGFLGQSVMVGNTTFSIEITTVFETTGCVNHATKRNTNVSKVHTIVRKSEVLGFSLKILCLLNIFLN